MLFRLLASLADRLGHVSVRNGALRFVASSPLALWRAQTALTKEPETVAWLQSMRPGDVLWDVGANVGVYTVLAAQLGLSVYAFEPEAENFALLNRNIALNKSDAVAYPLALADHPALDTLRLSRVAPGAALHCFGTNIDFRGQEFKPAFQQGSMAVTLDQLLEWLPAPNALKVDVDGLEARIVRGGRDVLAHPSLRTVLLELHTTLDAAVFDEMESYGFAIMQRGEDMGGAQNVIFERGATRPLADPANP